MTRQKLNSILETYRKEVNIGLILLFTGAYLALYASVGSYGNRLDNLENNAVQVNDMNRIERKLNDIDRKQDTIIFNQWKLNYEFQKHVNK